PPLPPPRPTLFPYTTLFRSLTVSAAPPTSAAPVIRSSAYDGLLVSPKPPGDRVLRFFQLRGQRDALGAPVRYNRHDQRMPGFPRDRKSTRLNSSHQIISYAV